MHSATEKKNSSISKIEQQQAIIMRVQTGTNQMELVRLVHAQAQALHKDALITLEFIVPDGSSHKIETIRALQTQLQYAATAQRPRWLCLLRAELLTVPAQNALLKIFEEPPPHTILLLCSSTPDRLLPTIRSRALEFSDDVLAQELGFTVPVNEDIETQGPTYTKLQSYSIAQACELAEQFSERESALVFIQQLLLEMHQSLQVALEKDEATVKILLKALNAAIQTTRQLEANCSVKLVMAEFLFGVCDLEQSNR